MTTTASDLSVPLLGGWQHFLLRRLHSLTGIMFGGYLVFHLLINATLAQFGGHYQEQVNKIHGLPLLWVLEWGGIYLPIIYHAVYGAWIILTGQPNVNSYPYGKNIYYLLQRVSAVIIVLFILFHVLSLKLGLFVGKAYAFDPHNAFWTISRHMKISPVIAWVVYPVGILSSCFHVANGFWTGAITWGLTTSAGSQRRWGFACVGIFIILLGAGVAALVAAALGHPS